MTLTRRLLICLALALPHTCQAVTLNVVETFNSGLAGFGGPVSYANPLGGVDGPGDGYLAISSTFANTFAVRAIAPSDFTGDYLAAGANAVRFSILDLDSEDAVVIRVGFGIRNVNFWVSNVGFDPVFGAPWQEVEVAFDDASQWTQVIGFGGPVDFDFARQNAEAFQLRADAAPGLRAPDAIVGSIGIDNISFVSIPEPSTGLFVALAGIAFLRRRR